MLTPKQMIQKLPVVFAEVKAGNTKGKKKNCLFLAPYKRNH